MPVKLSFFSRVLLLLFFVISNRLAAQITMIGCVRDSVSGEGLPFVNIGIRHKNIGTSGRSDGTFSITIPAGHEKDSLTFSLIGFHEVSIPLQSLSSTGNTIRLAAKNNSLNGVQIISHRTVEKKYGIKTHSLLFQIQSESENPGDILEVAQLIRLDTVPEKITAVNLWINETVMDSATFRINFYAYENDLPGKRLNEKSFLFTLPIAVGWLNFDLSKDNFYLQGKVVVSIELLPDPKRKSANAISYGVKLGGRSHSFFRSSSLGEWITPPHHYPILITALSEDETAPDDDDKESVPAFSMYSKTVQDSFYLFVHLPAKYNSRKKYPVVYVLDANFYFDALLAMLDAKQFPDDRILIGIGYKNFVLMDSLRERDDTYPPAQATDSMKISGGANRFYDFMRQELIPAVDSLYATDKNKRMLTGHSLSGYFTLYALLQDLQKQQTTFQQFAALSPSLEYAGKYLQSQFEQLAANQLDQQSRTVYMVMGEDEDREDGGTGTMSRDCFEAFAQVLSEKRFSHLHLKKETLPHRGHMDAALPGFKAGMNLFR